MVYNIRMKRQKAPCHIFIRRIISYNSLFAEGDHITNGFVPEGSLFGTAENTELTGSEAGLRLARQSERIVEGVAVSCSRDLDLHVDLGAYDGVIPGEETVYTDGGPVKDIAVISRVGKPVCFVVKELTGDGGVKTAVLSRAQAQKRCADGYLSYLRRGDVIDCRVTHTERFGAFADVGCGISALLPVDRISVSRISHASDRLRAGRISAVSCTVRSTIRSGCSSRCGSCSEHGRRTRLRFHRVRRSSV